MLPITFMMALATLKASAQNPDFLTLIKAATQAPSGHNSQPWWFETSDHSIVIKPNFEKALPAVDGQHRRTLSSAWVVRSKTSVSKPLSYSTKLM